MPFQNLSDFISFLENKGELRRIQVPVSKDLEITEITDRVCKQSGPALLFEKVQGYDIPVLMNAFGSYKRMAWALGAESLEEVAARVEELIQMIHAGVPPSLWEKLKTLGELATLASYAPKIVKDAPCQEVVYTGEQVDLYRYPILTCWPLDAGPFITLPLVFSKDPETGKRNCGMYRLQVYDKKTTGMHWHLHKGGAEHYRQQKLSGKPLEVAVALGGDPATIYAATAPLPPAFDEMVFAGYLRQAKVEMVRCKTVVLEVPAQAEIVLEGYVDPRELRKEGPFGDHTGYYSLADMYPVFHVTCITQRKNPIYPATIVGQPPMEDCYMGKATERIFLPLIKMVVPEVVDINMPLEGVFHNLVFVSIKKTYPGQAQKVMYALWGMGQMMFTKTIVVVDDNVDVQDTSQVLWRLGNNIDPSRDLTIVKGPLDALDHASPYPHFGSKLGVDATKKLPDEGHPRAWPPDIEMTEEIKRLVDGKWGEYKI